MPSVEFPSPITNTCQQDAALILTLPSEIMDKILDQLRGTASQMLRRTCPALKAKMETRPYKAIIMESRVSKPRVMRIAEVTDEARMVKTAFVRGDETTRRYLARHCRIVTMIDDEKWEC